jgi:short-subunit dehydrogenase
LIFNNAGVALYCELMDADFENFHWLMNINFWGVIHGSQAFLPKLIASGNGHIVNISSALGLISMPKLGTYTASKFAVRGYTETLAQELRIKKLPVKVSCVHPGFTATPIGKNARIGDKEDMAETRTLFDRVVITRAESAAKTIIRGVRKNKLRILVGPDALIAEILHRIMGSRYDRFIRLIVRKYQY